MIVTLKDIAAKTGVSTTTVSRILNGRESGVPIREETRQKVLSAAAEMGYRPNIMARALRGHRSSLVGVIAQNVTSRFQSQILRGLHEMAVQRGYRIFLGHVERQIDLAIDYGSMFEQSHADGILLIGELKCDQEALDKLVHTHRYMVGVSDRAARRSFPGVYADSVMGTHMALDHLWGLGHRRIICVADPSLQDSQLRAQIYQQFMQTKDATPYTRIFETSRSFEGSYRTGREIFGMLDNLERPTAIFATTDAIAIGLLQAAFQTSIHIPQQVSLIGFDDIDVAGYTIPPLTTIRQSGIEMGQVAANLLFDMIEQGMDSAAVADVVLTPTLIVRQSTAAPFDGQSPSLPA
jgi:DNA-binding LacI/PurR family transcriptional regulator